MHNKNYRRLMAMSWLFALGLGGVADGASAQNATAASGGASPQAEQRVRQDMQATLSNLGSSGALGQHPDQVAVSLDEPARRVTSLGALVDSTNAQSARDGLHVLGATPGSNADRLGLRPGDVIVAVNGTSLRDLGADQRGRALAATTLKTVVDGLPDDATLHVAVVRGGAPVTLSGPLEPVYLPAMHVDLGGAVASADVHPAEPLASTAPAAIPAADGCGRISMFDVSPRGEHLYGVKILLIDGTTPGPLGTRVFRVSAGEHHLLIAENIPTTQLGVGEFATFRRHTSKPLVVNVKPGTTAMLAAELHPGKTTQLNNGGYWDPVVWREVPEACP